MFKRLLFCLALLAACSPAASSNSAVSDNRVVPTIAPPAWVESDDIISLENVADIRYLGRLDGLGEPSTIFTHALSPDGTRLAGLDNEQMLVWDLIEGKVLFGTGRADANQVYYSPDKTEVYTVTAGGNVTIYDTERGAPQYNFELTENFNGVTTFYADDGWLAAGNLRGQAKIWDPLERQALATLDAHSLQIKALAFSADGEQLATAGEEGTVKVWDWRNRQVLHTLEDDRTPLVIRFSPDGTQLAVGNRENVRLWSLADDSLERIVDTGPGGVDALLYSPDGKYLVSGGAVADMSIWDPRTGNLVAKLPGVGGDRVSAAFSPDGTLLVTCVLGKPASLWNMTTINSQTVSRADLDTQVSLVLSVDWTADNRLITLFGVTSSVYIWGIGSEPE